MIIKLILYLRNQRLTMSVYFQRLNDAMKQSKKYLGTEQYQLALDALCHVITSSNYTSILESKTRANYCKHLDLCVMLRKSDFAMEELHCYSKICQNDNVKSLVNVISMYLSMASEKTDEICKKIHQVVDTIEDLEITLFTED